jgi:glucosamine--fructose-6-phosphate aminotransferase (isomerizing)
MCGILGYVGDRDASQILVDGLRKLEYRGYDSSGVAIVEGSQLTIRRSVGKLSALERLLKRKPVDGCIGLGHTRWATHGAPSEGNAHPHIDSSGRIVIVHNGIIENYLALKKKLQAQGVRFRSETDTEVVAHLISWHWQALLRRNSKSSREILIQAVRSALGEIRGTYALGIMCTALPDLVIGARRDCPLIVGVGKDENFLASDVPAVISNTRQVIFLEDGDVALIERNKVEIIDHAGSKAHRPISKISWNPAQAEKAGYPHFMLKEIHEQPRVVEDTLRGRLHMKTGDIELNELGLSEQKIKKIRKVRFVACGTSWHAALTGSYLIEKYSGIPCQVDIASEFRYRDPVVEPGTLVIAVSQSGETADTLAAIRLARKKGAYTLCIANVIGSSMTREAQSSLMTHCGPEIGVASTKAFTGQLVAMQMLALYLGRVRKSYPTKSLRALGKNLAHLSQWVTETLKCAPQVARVAKRYCKRGNFLFIGRNLNYPIALEGALKLKEISYIHAEGYPAGELKHGPIALIDRKMPIVAVAPEAAVYEKIASNIQEAKSRGADVIAIATRGNKEIKSHTRDVIYIPAVPEDLSPLLSVIPLQLLAYDIAVLLGRDVDQPRNLAKSVTVE